MTYRPPRRFGKASPLRRTLSESRRATFLNKLSELGNVTAAADAAGVRTQLLYDVRSRDETFAREWAEALDHAGDALETEAHRRAVLGVDEPFFQGGKQVGCIRRFSDTLLILLLKGARPDKFRERVPGAPGAYAANGAGNAPPFIIETTDATAPVSQTTTDLLKQE
jgi:hypothetical protein